MDRFQAIGSPPIEVRHINCGTMCPIGRLILLGEGSPVARARIVAHCLLIEAGGELVLVDTGYGLGDCANPKRLGQPFRAMVLPQLLEEETAIRRVETFGHDPKDVRHIVATHLDRDHAGGIGDFPAAEIHLFAAELAAAQNPSGYTERQRYHAEQWGENPNWVEYEAGGDRWFGFESVRVIPGLDAEIALIPLPGHTRGHCGVAINTSDGWLLHAGDSFFFNGEIETPRRCPPGLRIFQNINQWDGEARHRNQERLRELQREHGDVIEIFCSHDAKMFDEAGREPAAA